MWCPWTQNHSKYSGIDSTSRGGGYLWRGVTYVRRKQTRCKAGITGRALRVFFGSRAFNKQVFCSYRRGRIKDGVCGASARGAKTLFSFGGNAVTIGRNSTLQSSSRNVEAPRRGDRNGEGKCCDGWPRWLTRLVAAEVHRTSSNSQIPISTLRTVGQVEAVERAVTLRELA